MTAVLLIPHLSFKPEEGTKVVFRGGVQLTGAEKVNTGSGGYLSRRLHGTIHILISSMLMAEGLSGPEHPTKDFIT